MMNEAFVYKWTNEISEEYYIGVHKGTVDDGYIGSGKRFKAKYYSAPELYNREILAFYETYEEALLHESNIVTEELILSDPKCLNLVKGGNGGPVSLTDEWIENIRIGVKASQTDDHKLRQTLAGNYFPNKTIDVKKRTESRKSGAGWGQNKGNKRSIETKKLMSISSLNVKKIECNHCGKIGRKPAMTRWHLDNCKRKLACI